MYDMYLCIERKETLLQTERNYAIYFLLTAVCEKLHFL